MRAALRTHRAQPGRFGDSAPELRVGYNRLTQRWLVIIQLGSLAFMGLDAIAYDLKTGAPFDLMAVVRRRNAEVEAHNRRVDEQRKANDAIRAERKAEEERLGQDTHVSQWASRLRVAGARIRARTAPEKCRVERGAR